MTHSTFDCPLTTQYAIPGFDKSGKMIPHGFESNPYSASGGLWSTASDIAKWMIALCDAYQGKNTIFISQELAHEMLTQQSHSDFALGVVVDGANDAFNFRKTGHNNGYYCQLLMFPNIKQGIVVMTNSATGITLINEFISTIAEKYQWPKYSENFDELNTPKTIMSKSK
jgi:CubicO group peptidase (beta-lactamase class C family)